MAGSDKRSSLQYCGTIYRRKSPRLQAPEHIFKKLYFVYFPDLSDKLECLSKDTIAEVRYGASSPTLSMGLHSGRLRLVLEL